jgi:hypothetical protein
MTNRLRAGARAGVCVGSGACCWGLGVCLGCVTFRRGDKKDKYLARARVREGHPTPPAYAMQSRHIFCIFKLTAQVSREHVGGKTTGTHGKPREHVVYPVWGYIPAGLSPLYSRISHLSTLFIFFC